MLITSRSSRFIHRTLLPEYVEFVTLRRRQENTPVNQWVQEKWRGVELDDTEETDPTGQSYLTVLMKHWYLIKENVSWKAPMIGDQIVEADGTVTELNSAAPVIHQIFRNYMFEIRGTIQAVP